MPARWCGMRIERFSIGFGPGILKRKSKKTGTTFQIAPIPFGGFVEIRGMNIAEAGTLVGAGQAAAAGETTRRGKSGHRRAGWSGHRPGETRGKVPQKHTADGEASRGSRTGKGEMVR